MRGRVFSQDMGDLESGKKADITFHVSCTAYKEVIDKVAAVIILQGALERLREMARVAGAHCG